MAVRYKLAVTLMAIAGVCWALLVMRYMGP